MGQSAQTPYDSLDPATGFFVTDGYFANVFQGLDQYNGSSATQVVPSLASSWTVSSNYENYTFTMRPNTWFSNKDPINAYVAWFSFVRGNWINAPIATYYSNYIDIFYSGSVPYNTSCSSHPTSSACQTMPDAVGNLWPWGLEGALSATFHIPITDENGLVAALNNVLSHFDTSNSSIQALMAYPHQAFVASGASTFQMNLIQPYRLLLLALPPQWGAMVDPVYIDANGGVANNTVPANFYTKGMPGSGPYMYGTIGSGQTLLTLNANPNYWAQGVPGLDKVLQPAIIKTIIMKFGVEPATQIEDFASNNAQLVDPQPAEFGNLYAAYKYSSYFPFSQLLRTAGYPLCDLANGMNTQVFPTNSTLLREGIVHAINYTQFVSELYTFQGQPLAQLFLPPVPPGWGPLDNPANTPLYSYNITLAAQYVNAAGIQGHYYTVMANGTILGDASGTLLPPLQYDYLVPLSPTQLTVNSILSSDLGQVGIRITPTGITEGEYAVETATPQSTVNINMVGWCADWPDPVFQQFNDLATEAAHENNWVDNASLNEFAAEVPFETDQALQIQQMTTAYQMFTQLATIIQYPNVANIFITQPYVQNLVYSPFQFAVFYNLAYYSPATGS